MGNINKHCATCSHFVWWDGDYCCIKNLKILQESADGNFHTEIPIKDCNDYNEDEYKIYYNIYKEFLKEHGKDI